MANNIQKKKVRGEIRPFLWSSPQRSAAQATPEEVEIQLEQALFLLALT